MRHDAGMGREAQFMYLGYLVYERFYGCFLLFVFTLLFVILAES